MRLLWAIWGLLLPLTLFGQACGFIEPEKAHRGLYARQADPGGVLVVPVVVHVVHLGEPIGEGTNISYAKIQQAIELLNHDFRRVEGTAGEGEGVDTEIEFCLAARDPDGQATTGVVRHDGSDLSYTWSNGVTKTYAEDGVGNTNALQMGVPDSYFKSTLGPWPVQQYCNIWIVSEINGNDGFGGVQGYSYLGATNNHLDGPVQLYNTFGTLPPTKASNYNRTTTHELGHYLSLWHTFSNSTSCTAPSSCASTGDYICDTPHTTANNSCSFPSCPEAMVTNYMDYTPQSCKNAFTEGQRERMRQSILQERPDLNELACTSPQEYDAAVVNLAVPATTCLDSVPSAATFANLGTENLEGVVVHFMGWVDTLNLAPQQQHTLEGYVEPGVLTATAAHPWDQNSDNDALSAYLEAVPGNALRFELEPDVWSNEISWQLLDPEGQPVLSGGGLPVFSQDSLVVINECIGPGCYTWRMTDSNGDGLCQLDWDNDGQCEVGGQFRLYVNGELVVEEVHPQYDVQDWPLCGDPCLGDIDGDGSVGTQDLLALLQAMGSSQEAADLDGNGQVAVADLVILLANYGGACGQIATLSGATQALERLGYEYQVRSVRGQLVREYRPGFYILQTSIEGKPVRIPTYCYGSDY